MPRISRGSPWQQFKARWNNCTLCSLCEGRTNVVLAKGSIPCDVLFIGEAPGPSEDVLRKPFVGPAGKLLDRMIEDALANVPGVDLRMAFTNLVCCIPRESLNTKKFKEPPQEAIRACSERLDEFVHLCCPRLIVLVGDLAEKSFSSRYVPESITKITHPAAIMRAEIVRQELMFQKQVVMLENAFGEM